MHFLLSQGAMKGPSKHRSLQIKELTTTKSIWIFDIYTQYISPVDGDRCPMSPSCSEYALKEFAKHGFFLGFIKTTDRLIRCGNDLKKYRHIVIHGRDHFLDNPD